MIGNTPLRPAPDDPVTGRLVIVGCSRRKLATTVPVPALDLYQGGCIPPLRERLGSHPALLARVRILSAEHGIVHADTPLLPYDNPLTPTRAAALRLRLRSQVTIELITQGIPRQLLVVAEAPYLQLIADDFRRCTPRPRLSWISDPSTGWPDAAAILDRWGWP